MAELGTALTGFVLTLWLHASVLLGVVWLLERCGALKQADWAETAWRGALFGALLSASIWSKAASDEWLASITMPSRFISATHCRPSGLRPFQRGVSVVLSANWLFFEWTGPAIRTPIL